MAGIPGSSVDLPDGTTSELLLGTFTTTDVDTSCAINPPTAPYEIRDVTSPANALQPGIGIYFSLFKGRSLSSIFLFIQELLCLRLRRFFSL